MTLNTVAAVGWSITVLDLNATLLQYVHLCVCMRGKMATEIKHGSQVPLKHLVFSLHMHSNFSDLTVNCNI